MENKLNLTIYRRTSKRIQTAGKGNNRSLSNKKIRDSFNFSIQLIGEISWSNVASKGKFTNITMV